jgi:hypothetical protein
MKLQLKNSIAGFMVSFIGSVPLGYLNVIGYGIYKEYGTFALTEYLCGILLAESVYLYGILYLLKDVGLKNGLIKKLGIASIIFLLLLAFFYWPSSQNYQTDEYSPAKIIVIPFLTGLVLNALNFTQVPFWAGWNLYLLNNKSVNFTGKLKHYFVAGAVTGTFLGMLTLIFLLSAVPEKIISPSVLQYIYPFIFIALAAYQLFKLLRLFYSGKNISV